MTLKPILTDEMPVLALRGLVIFPDMLLHFDVTRAASVEALNEAMEKSRPIFLVPQKDIQVEEPKGDDLFEVGTVCSVRQVLRLPGGSARALVEGTCRGRLLKVDGQGAYLRGTVERILQPKAKGTTAKTEALIRYVYEQFSEYAKLVTVAPETMLAVLHSTDPGYIADHITQNISIRPEDKQGILAELRPVRRLEKLSHLLQREIEINQLERDVEAKTQKAMDDAQRDYFLREQLKVIQDELHDGEEDEFAEYRRKIQEAKLPEEVEKQLLKELSRLEKQPFGSAEATVSRNYLDICLELPWGKVTEERLDLAATRAILDRDHYGLEKVKERILEYVAVRSLVPELKSQIICLVGPPGVGKTSIANSIAQALGRNLGRISLGGVHDEAEIRGHRKTYVGAMPGRIINGLRQAGSANPVLVLDEIDKMGQDGRSDPSSALLEVLDPEQNATFRDNFVEMPFDLSQVLFITTANSLETIPRPLLDRMEIIELPSYTDEEKLQIARHYLLTRQAKRHGLKGRQIRVSEGALKRVITAYTKESGVRLLEQQLAKICRKAAVKLVSDEIKSVSVTEKNLEEFLGTPKYRLEEEALLSRIGVVNGLAWTEVGGELLEVEVGTMPGEGKVKLTGNLGKVMEESAQAAWSYLRANAGKMGLKPDFYQHLDLHVHFPEGATPKDGPSAGCAILTAMTSALTGRAVRGGIAMTGEITLRGRVLPIGGLREKTMAALRNGVHEVLIPKDNEKDLEEIDPLVREQIQFHIVSTGEEVLALALMPEEQALAREEEAPEAAEKAAKPYLSKNHRGRSELRQ